ncbi:MAG: tripartite tricarboxylate transporter TctB family protein [Desulfobacterota bacterium]|nr:tripartite tricarboxylate transporter TctB family protein [Thermodesulfobacteriota bacterium]
MTFSKRRDQISSLFWLFVGLGFASGGMHYGFGSWREPGAGFLPLLFGVLLAFMSLLLFIAKLKSTSETGANPFWLQGGSWATILLTFLSLVAYMALLKPAGFIVTTFLFILFLMKGISSKSWRASLIMAFSFSLLGYGLFSLLLGVLLPTGTLYGSALGYLVRV